MNDNQSEALLPCPFKSVHRVRIYHDKYGYRGECCDCGFKLPTLWNAEQEAIADWNTRHTPTPPSPDDLAKALEEVKKLCQCSEHYRAAFEKVETAVNRSQAFHNTIQYCAGILKDFGLDAAAPLEALTRRMIKQAQELQNNNAILSESCAGLEMERAQLKQQVQGLREQLNESHQSVHKWSNKSVDLAEKVVKIEQSARDKDAEIEKLKAKAFGAIGALARLGVAVDEQELSKAWMDKNALIEQLVSYFERWLEKGYSSCECGSANQLAHSKGYGNPNLRKSVPSVAKNNPC